MYKLIMENFQGFEGRQSIALSRLNLIFGPNASGKSSIARGLQSLQTSIDSRTMRLVLPEGLSHDSLVFGNDNSKEIGIGIGISMINWPGLEGKGLNEVELIFYSNRAEFHLSLGDAFADNWSGWAKVEISWCDPLTGDGEWYIDEDSRVVLEKHFLAYLDGDATVPDIKPDVNVTASNANSSPDLSWLLFDALVGPEPENFAVEEDGSFSFFGGRREQTLSAVLNLSVFVVDFVTKLRDVVFGDPNRKPFSDLTVTSGLFGQREEELVNGWLGRLTDGRYQLFQDETVNVGRKIGVQGIYDTFTKTKSLFENVGAGLAHVLPILGQLAAGQNNYLFQPELHLHPKMQSELVDILIEQGHEGLTSTFIETHSESILLRVQKRIREGVLDKQLVSVIYCEAHDGKRNRMSNFVLDDIGDILDPFPESFAALRIQDLL